MIGQDCYLGSSHDAADHVDPADRFRYIDDLEILELIMISGILIDYDVYTHVPSDIPVDHQFLPTSATQTQVHLDRLAEWTEENKMKLNPDKCNYMILSRAKNDFVTRLSVNGTKIDQKSATKILGCWVDQDVGKWGTNTRELCKSAYSRISMLTKLHYVGVCTEDLIEIYVLFIRSRAEYMSVLWHSSLTVEQSNKIETIQRTYLKIILQENYVDYSAACEMTGLEELSIRRKNRCLQFAKKCLKNPLTYDMFPTNPPIVHNVRVTEKYHVNFAHTESYKQSAVPYCQRLLNQDTQEREERERVRCRQRGGGGG